MSSTRQVGPSEGSAFKKSDTDENCWVCKPTDRNRRPTESRNSGSSSMIKTLGFASRIARPCMNGAPSSRSNVLNLPTIRRSEQARSPKRIGKAPKPSLRTESIALLLNFAKLHVAGTGTRHCQCACSGRQVETQWRQSRLISIVEDDRAVSRINAKADDGAGLHSRSVPIGKGLPSIPSPRCNRVFGQRRADARHEWC